MAYGTDEGLQAWATENGFELPAEPSPAVMRQRGSVYIDGVYGDPLAPRTFKGYPTGGFTQPQQWPRTGVTAYKQTVPDNVIPIQIEHAAYYAGYLDATNPGSLDGSVGQSGAIKKEELEGLKVEYFGPGSSTTVLTSTQAPTFSYIEGLLAAFLTGSAQASPVGLWSIGPKSCQGEYR